MKQQYKHAANESPRSGSSKQTTPMVWAVVVAVIVAAAIWLAIKT